MSFQTLKWVCCHLPRNTPHLSFESISLSDSHHIIKRTEKKCVHANYIIMLLITRVELEVLPAPLIQ